jgi:hypothetical protein
MNILINAMLTDSIKTKQDGKYDNKKIFHLNIPNIDLELDAE